MNFTQRVCFAKPLRTFPFFLVQPFRIIFTKFYPSLIYFPSIVRFIYPLTFLFSFPL